MQSYCVKAETCLGTMEKRVSQKSPSSLVRLKIGELMTILACKVPRKPRKNSYYKVRVLDFSRFVLVGTRKNTQTASGN